MEMIDGRIEYDNNYLHDVNDYIVFQIDMLISTHSIFRKNPKVIASLCQYYQCNSAVVTHCPRWSSFA